MNRYYTPVSPVIKRLLCLVMSALLTLTSVMAEDNAANPSVPNDVPSSNSIQKGFRFFDPHFGARKWGLKADAVLGFRFLENDDTGLWGRIGASYGNGHYYRLPFDNSMYNMVTNPGIPSFADTASTYWRFNMFWGLGIMQGLHFNYTKDRDDLNLLLSYRGWGDANTIDATTGALLAQSSIPDRIGNVTNSFQLDLMYNTVNVEKDTKVREGVRVDSSVEYAPAGISTPVYISFLQYNVDVSGFLPLYRSTTDSGWNLFSLYLAGHISVDYIQGLGSDARKGIPMHVSERFGGYSYEDGLGGMLRGLGDGYNDGTFKTVGNLELRMNLPAMLDHDLLPGLVAYVDAGAFAAPPNIATTDPHYSGFIVGAGLGLFADVFDLGYLAVYTNFILNDTSFRGSHWEPISFEFGLHF